MKLIELLQILLKDKGWPEELGGYYVQDGDDGFVKWSKVPFKQKCSSPDGLFWAMPPNGRKGMPDFQKQPISEDWETTIVTRDMYISAISKTSICQCKCCHEGDDYNYLKSKLSEEDQVVLEKLYEELVHTRIDLNWYEAVFDGTWPTAEEHMRRAGWVKQQ